ncbi:hypothetical protein C0989_008536 [Termitomyces sp. Mn162]|nr:hypothetical protein C0989_008536 [Termitomyces sp. Mn162]
MAKGFSQIPGVDYFATYASLVKYKSLHINLAVGAVLDYELWQVNYTSAYLNVPTQVPILPEQLEGYAVRLSKVYCVDISEGRQVWGSNEAGSAVGEVYEEDSEKELVTLVDKALYGTMDAARN